MGLHAIGAQRHEGARQVLGAAAEPGRQQPLGDRQPEIRLRRGRFPHLAQQIGAEPLRRDARPSGPPPAASCCASSADMARIIAMAAAGCDATTCRIGSAAMRTSRESGDRLRAHQIGFVRQHVRQHEAAGRARGCRSPCSMHRPPCRSDSPGHRAARTAIPAACLRGTAHRPASTSARSPAAATCSSDVAVQLGEARHRSEHRLDRLHCGPCVTNAWISSLHECGGAMPPSVFELVGQPDAGPVRRAGRSGGGAGAGARRCLQLQALGDVDLDARLRAAGRTLSARPDRRRGAI